MITRGHWIAIVCGLLAACLITWIVLVVEGATPGVTLAWDLKPPGDGCTGYNMYRATKPDMSDDVKLTATPIAATVNTYTDATIVVGKTYYWTVTAVYPTSLGGETGKSNVVTKSVPLPAPANHRLVEATLP